MCKLVYNKYSPDKKDISILLTFLGWLIVGFCIIFVGLNNVFALEFEKPNYINFYDNTGTTLTSLGATCDQVRCISEQTATLVANSTGAVVAFQLDTQLIKGYNYSVTIFVDIKDSNDDDGISLSSKNYIGIGSNVTNARNNYINKTGVTINTSYAGRNHVYYNFTVTSSTASQYIVIPFTTKQTVQNAYIRFWGSELISNGSGLTENQIDTITNNQTTILNNSIDNSKNEIINNQNQNNEELKDTIKDQFNDCRDSVNLWGNLTWETSVYKYFKLPKENTYYTLSFKLKDGVTMPNDLFLGFTENGRFLSGQNTKWIIEEGIINGSITNDSFYMMNNYQNKLLEYISVYPSNYVNNLTDYFEIMLNEGSTAKPYEPYGEEICTNKIDETNNKLNNIDDTLNNSDSTGATNDASNFFSNFTTDTFGLTSVITAPLNIINSITTSSCNDLNLPLPYLNNKYITLPCMNSIYTRYFGVFFSLYQTITFGIVSYWVIVRIFNQVKDFKNPEHDEIEVLDL